jgi:hypothetical protein
MGHVQPGSLSLSVRKRTYFNFRAERTGFDAMTVVDTFDDALEWLRAATGRRGQVFGVLLTDLAFAWDGVVCDETTANTFGQGDLVFDAVESQQVVPIDAQAADGRTSC